MTEPLPKIDLKLSKMLVVDNNAPSLEILQQILWGFRVNEHLGCHSAKDADEHLSKTRFDLIIADVEMPDEDGISLTRRVRRNFAKPNAATPVILLAGAPSLDVLTAARDAGANIVIKKPVTPALLLSRITWLAKSPREFVRCEGYCGPDRRFRREPLPEGVSERRACELALGEDGDRVLDQSEIDNMFN